MLFTKLFNFGFTIDTIAGEGSDFHPPRGDFLFAARTKTVNPLIHPLKRGVDIACLERQPPDIGNQTARQTVLLKQGIDTDLAKRMVKDIKASKSKVQAQIQGEQLRVTGKKRDDLQQVIALLKDGGYGLPIQFTNFRD